MMKPIIFLAFANDRNDDGEGYLRNLPKELEGVRRALYRAQQAGLCEVVERANSTVYNIMDVFQDERYRDRIAVFHYGGHANGYQLLLESAEGGVDEASSEGLVPLLARQKGLKLVFLNGCSSQQQAMDLSEAGAPIVIGTSQAISDDIATKLSIRFYSGLAAGASINRAWLEAVEEVKIRKGNHKAVYRGLYWKGQEKNSDRFPWNILVREGAEDVKEWDLPKAVNNPLFGIPDIPQEYYERLPERPYRFLKYFQQCDAAIFFGRGKEIRQLYDKISGIHPVILFYGKSGVGKSSLLYAGLLPRIEQEYRIVYIRRIQEIGLEATLRQAVRQLESEEGVTTQDSQGFTDELASIRALKTAIEGSEGIVKQILERELEKLGKVELAASTLAKSWLEIEAITDKPLIVILDQVEECFTRPMNGKHSSKDENRGELARLLGAVQELFRKAETRPRGKIILSYRKEFHPEIELQCKRECLPYTELFIRHLDKQGVIEAVEGITQNSFTDDKYKLSLEKTKEADLPTIIADDLLEGDSSTIAPLLQIILTKMWFLAEPAQDSSRHFSVKLYQNLRKKGMDAFFRQQMELFSESYPKEEAAGLGLDILFFHTTFMGTAAAKSQSEVIEHYAHINERDIQGMLQTLKDLFLLASITEEKNVLAHDTLAPIVIGAYNHSDKAGQRAGRILRTKTEEFRTTNGKVWLDKAELGFVESGLEGMRIINEDERSLIDFSRGKESQRQKRNRQIRRFGIASIASIVLLAIFSLFQWATISEQKEEVAVKGLVAASQNMYDEPKKALWLAEYAFDRAMYPKQFDYLRNFYKKAALNGLMGHQYNLEHDSYIESFELSPDSSYMQTVDQEGVLRIWSEKGLLVGKHSFYAPENVPRIAFAPDDNGLLLIDSVKTIIADHTLNMRDTFFHSTLLGKGKPNHLLINTENVKGGSYIAYIVDGKVGVWDMRGELVATVSGSISADDTPIALDSDAVLWIANENRLYKIPLFERQSFVIDSLAPTLTTDKTNPFYEMRLIGGGGDLLFVTAKGFLAVGPDGKELGRFDVDLTKEEFNKIYAAPDGFCFFLYTNQTLVLWNGLKRTFSLIKKVKEGESDINFVFLIPQSHRIWVVGNVAIEQWTIEGKQLNEQYVGDIEEGFIRFSSKGMVMMKGAGTGLFVRGFWCQFIVWDSTAKQVATFESKKWHLNEDNKVVDAIFSTSGEQVLTCTKEDFILWKLNGDIIDEYVIDETSATVFGIGDKFFGGDGHCVLTKVGNTVYGWLSDLDYVREWVDKQELGELTLEEKKYFGIDYWEDHLRDPKGRMRLLDLMRLGLTLLCFLCLLGYQLYQWAIRIPQHRRFLTLGAYGWLGLLSLPFVLYPFFFVAVIEPEGLGFISDFLNPLFIVLSARFLWLSRKKNEKAPRIGVVIALGLMLLLMGVRIWHNPEEILIVLSWSMLWLPMLIPVFLLRWVGQRALHNYDKGQRMRFWVWIASSVLLVAFLYVLVYELVDFFIGLLG